MQRSCGNCTSANFRKLHHDYLVKVSIFYSFEESYTAGGINGCSIDLPVNWKILESLLVSPNKNPTGK